jgi:hypothetical protein
MKDGKCVSCGFEYLEGTCPRPMEVVFQESTLPDDFSKVVLLINDPAGEIINANYLGGYTGVNYFLIFEFWIEDVDGTERRFLEFDKFNAIPFDPELTDRSYSIEFIVSGQNPLYFGKDHKLKIKVINPVINKYILPGTQIVDMLFYVRDTGLSIDLVESPSSE